MDDEWMGDGWMDEWIMDGWLMGGWTDGWVVERMGGRCPAYKELTVV